MPVACSSQSLTGQEGSIYFSPSGTKWCLRDYSDFPSGTDITVPAGSDYRVNDPLKFSVVNTATLDSALTANSVYYVTNVSSDKIKVRAKTD